MVMDQSQTLAHTIDGQAVRCGYCPKRVVFYSSVYGGHALCFDVDLMPVRADRERTGWLPGQFLVDGEVRTVHAPWPMHGYITRRRAGVVHQLHICSGQSRAVAA
jgi:hypothetical protein